MKIKKIALCILSLLLIFTSLIGCSKNTSSKGDDKTVIKLGITGEDRGVWKNIKERLAKENIDLQIISFSDYNRPNLALSDGEIDANAFQTIAFFDKFKSDHNLDLVSIGYTVLAPMGIYSEKLKNLDELKNNSKIAIPNDASNGGRALILLQSAGFIKLRDEVGITPTVKDIIENPKNLDIVELAATQIPRSMKDVDIAVINNGVAVDAGYSPVKDSILIEDTKDPSTKNYFNIIAVNAKDKDNVALKKLIQTYQTEETKKLIDDLYKGSSIPAF
ncbi:MetQ/NlpA family ABC transporter substrate-binding protein [uncultured Clostridium sp.]|uniref:MetQ/NlpA family ABC transporter substrate-binding protein n=1 Tax=uncultured Clostridium sp. TaxID=59620 RepID=UPI0028ECECFB|nr:MetQ/NlpA family ABC transporter substrate-binding protein [uncultured Clostridium sp.]